MLDLEDEASYHNRVGQSGLVEMYCLLVQLAWLERFHINYSFSNWLVLDAVSHCEHLNFEPFYSLLGLSKV